ncbi:hypothetical protein OS493_012364 [Desmophyllum pertusum]|uniref:Tyr recombinase domain-containing protein n=1 Tax=Desmophyllum pertusum TaxID=174260 RepID=A0A9W9ZQN0_9CNID|nr:hypothetical protein OS493_012364 [Desmophyllum pertusum]
MCSARTSGDSNNIDNIWYNPELSASQKLEILGQSASDCPSGIDDLDDSDKLFKSNCNLVPSSETLQMQYKFYATLSYAAEYTGQRVLKESFEKQAHTVNLLHSTKHGSPVDFEKYGKITAEEIREVVKDMNWGNIAEEEQMTRKGKSPAIRSSMVESSRKRKSLDVEGRSATDLPSTKRKSSAVKRPASVHASKKDKSHAVVQDQEESEDEDQQESEDQDQQQGEDEDQEDSEDEDQQESEDQDQQQSEDEKQDSKRATPNTSKKRKKNPKKHYKSRQCPICHKSREKIPVARAEAIIQMSYHGNSTRGRKRQEGKGKKKKVFRGRRREICPLCDRVELFLSTHLQRYHQLDRKSTQYKNAIRVARQYEGVAREIMWDNHLYENRKKKPVQPADSDDSDYGPADHHEAQEKDPIRLLAEEMSTNPSLQTTGAQDIIPPSPRIGRRSFSTPKDLKVQDEELHSADGRAVEDGSSNERELDKESLKQPLEESEEDSNDEVELGDDDDESYSIEEISDEENLEEEALNFESLTDYYKRAVGKNTFDTLVILFCQHLQDINGGACKERQAILHAQNVRKIKESLDPKELDQDVESLVKDGDSFIWRHWAKPLLDNKSKRPGTIRAYFCSVAKFFEFILDHTDHGVDGMPDILEDSLQRVQKILPRVRAWGSSINKLYVHEKWSKVLEDRQNSLKPENVEDMMATEAALKAIAFLKKSDVEAVSDKEFVAIRDFLIARIQLENGQRPGPIETAMVEDFQKAEQQKQGYIMLVVKHKTARAGPAPLYMSNNLYSNVKTYVSNVRPLFVAKNEKALFIKKDGKPFQAGTIGRRVTDWWEKAKQLKVNSTKVRKMAASTLHHAQDADKRAVHNLMTHRASTAEQYYMIDNINEVAERGAMVLRKNLNLPPSIETPSSGSTLQLTEVQLDDVDLLFAGIVQTNGPLTMNDTRNMMSESMSLFPLVSEPTMVKKVYDRVAYLKKKEPFDAALAGIEEQSAEDKAKEWMSDRDSVLASETVSQTSSRSKWNAQDTNMIEAAFHAFDKCPKKDVIQVTFKSHETLRDIMERNTFPRCYEKVKNVFKKKKN